MSDVGCRMSDVADVGRYIVVGCQVLFLSLAVFVWVDRKGQCIQLMREAEADKADNQTGRPNLREAETG